MRSDWGEAHLRPAVRVCHHAGGKGVARMYPPLAGNANVQSRDATSIVRVILQDGAGRGTADTLDYASL